MRRLVVTLAAVAVAMLAVPAVAPAVDTALTARLKGKSEVPGPGDKNGRGFAAVVLDGSAKQVCFVLSWNKIGEPVAAHIHRGKKGVAGPVVVPLFSATPAHAACVDITGELLKKIRNKPKNYYVNIHTAEFPDGAIRGQLRKVD
jgi:CHRD domain-containing protein